MSVFRTPSAKGGDVKETQQDSGSPEGKHGGTLDLCLRDAIELEPAKREELRRGDGFLLRGFLTRDECARLIETAEKRGFTTLPESSSALLRTNTRIVVSDSRVAMQLWERVRSHVPPTVSFEGAEWKATGLNERIRLCRYVSGQFFERHVDGYYEASPTEQSMLTFMIYLNTVRPDGGGATTFYRHDGRETVVDYAVQPEAGMLIAFHPEKLHDGGKLLAGIKYILRSDIMYTRAPTLVNAPASTTNENLNAIKS